jgi:hypothetical protein
MTLRLAAIAFLYFLIAWAFHDGTINPFNTVELEKVLALGFRQRFLPPRSIPGIPIFSQGSSCMPTFFLSPFTPHLAHTIAFSEYFRF